MKSDRQCTLVAALACDVATLAVFGVMHEREGWYAVTGWVTGQAPASNGPYATEDEAVMECLHSAEAHANLSAGVLRVKIFQASHA